MKEDESDDFVIEPAGEEEESGGEEKAEHKVAKLREELSACRREKQEYMDGWQRAKADYVNAIKRFSEDAAALELKGKIRATEALLPAFDALERAKDHGEMPAGFAAIAKQMEAAFASLGLEELGAPGEKFNPAFHEALGTDPAETLEIDDTITVVLEKGWKIGSVIVRPAKVRVAHFTSKNSETD